MDRIKLIAALFILTVFYFFPAGLLPQEPIESSDSSELNKPEELNYWDNGVVSEVMIYDPEKDLHIKKYYTKEGELERIEKYNKYGLRVEESFYDAKGRLRLGVDGWAARRSKYIERKLFQETFYAEDGKPIERKTYNEDGRIVARQYINDGTMDPDEKLATEPLAGKQYVMFYDPNGNVEAARFINTE